TNDHDLLLCEWHAGDADSRDQRRRSHRCRALNVVVEGAELIPVAGQKSGGVRTGKVLPLQQNMRPALLHAGHESIHEIVVVLAAHAVMVPADIDRTVQPLLIVGSDVEQNRKTVFRMDPAERRVKRHLSDRDSHAPGALIAEPQDSLAVAHHNALDVVVVRVAQNLTDAILVWIAQEQAARLSPDLAETLTAFTHSRRVDERQHLLDVTNQERIEKRLVGILKVAKKAVFGERARLLRQRLLAAFDLLLEAPHVRRQQS